MSFKLLIGAHPIPKNKAMFLLVFRINLAALYCYDSNAATLALEDGTQAVQL